MKQQNLIPLETSQLIRHSGVEQVPGIDVNRADYLFHRTFAMIQLLMRNKCAA